MIKIKPLTKKTLKKAIALVDAIFSAEGEAEEPANIVFPASLNPKKYRDFLLKAQMLELRYWVVIEGEKVVGTIGLYCYEKDKEEAYWLGWFCVHPDAREGRMGTQLLQFAINTAKGQGKKFLRLYTASHPNEYAAHRLYEKYGFRVVGVEWKAYGKFAKLYYELKL